MSEFISVRQGVAGSRFFAAIGHSLIKFHLAVFVSTDAIRQHLYTWQETYNHGQPPMIHKDADGQRRLVS